MVKWSCCDHHNNFNINDIHHQIAINEIIQNALETFTLRIGERIHSVEIRISSETLHPSTFKSIGEYPTASAE